MPHDSDTIDAATKELSRVLIDLARDHPKVIDSLAAVIKALTALRSSPSSGAPDVARDSSGPESAASMRDVPLGIGGVEMTLTVPDSGSPIVPPASPVADEPPANGHERTSAGTWREREVDLSRTAAHARFMAEAIRFAIERKKRDHAEIRDRERELGNTARALKCNAWMLNPYGPHLRADEHQLTLTARCYEVVAVCADVAMESFARIDPDDATMHRDLSTFLHLAAEVQSALRGALTALDISNDADQLDLFAWIRTQAEEQRCYVSRYLSRHDIADFEAIADLEARLTAFLEELGTRRDREVDRHKAINRIRFHVSKLESADPDEAEHHWQRIAGVIERWVTEGNHVTDRLLHEALAEVADSMPDEHRTGHVATVMSAVQAWLASEQAAPTEAEEGDEPVEWSEEVRRVRKLVEGTVMVFVGGRAKPNAAARLVEAFGLADFRWLGTQDAPYSTVTQCEPEIRRPNVSVVLVGIRFTSHELTEGIPRRCRDLGKAAVRLAGGYGVNAVAHAILEQASVTLEGRHPGKG